MCGFIVVLTLRGAGPTPEHFARRTDLLSHRGPDGRGTIIEAPIALGFRRLAIFDLTTAADQPMNSSDGRHVIVFNGAIYNYLELRAELVALGHCFRSTSDTEVLLNAYRQWGTECLPRLNGMWAFAIWDRQEQKLFAARDRFGVKPMYVMRDEHSVSIASEIKALRFGKHSTNDCAVEKVADFILGDALDVSDETFFREIHRVPAGSAFSVDRFGKTASHAYWSLAHAAAAIDLPTDPTASFSQIFDDAVKLRLRSDVKVGVFLSGGLDSTSIMCAMARRRAEMGQTASTLLAFSFGAPEYDESAQIAATIAQTGAELVQYAPKPRDLWDRLARHLWHQDEPVHSMTSLVIDGLAQLARQRGVTVLLNGQGADEVLAGYGSYFVDYWSELMRTGVLTRLWREVGAHRHVHGRESLPLFMAALNDTGMRLAGKLPFYSTLWAGAKRRRAAANSWLQEELRASWQPRRKAAPKSLNEALRFSVERANLPLYERIEDRNAMAHGIETRLPFLDYRLVQLAFRLGAEWKLRGGETKHILREAMRGRIPESVRVARRKIGFSIPADRWFREELYEPMNDLLSSRALRETGWWCVPEIRRDLERHRKGELQIGSQLFDVAQVAIWHDSTCRNLGSNWAMSSYKLEPVNSENP